MRLFVAVWPPPEVLGALRTLPRPAVPGLRWTSEDQWHVTLRFLGACEPADVLARWAPVVATGPPTAALGPRTDRFGRRVLHVPVRGLEEVAAAVVAATADVGEPPEPRPFSGHLTLARARRGDVDLRPLAGAPVAGTWQVAEITLVASRLHRDGARYEIIERLPLTGCAG